MTQRTDQPRRIPLAVATIAAALVVFVSQGGAQSEKQAPGLFKPLPQKRDEPVKISSATLEVRDKSKMATFSGDVHVIQGETEVRCNVLVVFYDDEKDGKDKSSAKKAPAPEGGRNQQIRRMEAKGNVIVTQKEQRAVGDRAEFDMRTNTVTHDRQRGRDEGRRRVARPADGGRSDHRCVAGRIRRWPGRGHLPVEIPAQAAGKTTLIRASVMQGSPAGLPAGQDSPYMWRWRAR